MADMPETPSQAKARRRRWLTLGEIIAVLALVISAASLWDAHQDRAAKRAETAAVRPAPLVPLVLRATTDDSGETLKITANRDRIIETQTISFPVAIATDAQDTIGNPRIEAGWFADGLRRALNKAGARPDAAGKRARGRLPILVITHYLDDGVPHSDRALYDIGYGWRSRLIGSDVPVLEGITLVTRGDARLQARLDTRWEELHPAR
jgi:hypothetical protein